MFTGSPGIGKSEGFKDAASQMAKEFEGKGRFGLIDERASQKEPSDVIGVPSVVYTSERIEKQLRVHEAVKKYLSVSDDDENTFRETIARMYNELKTNGDRPSTEWAPPFWLPQIHRDGEYGIIFLDEFNHATPSVQAAFYQLILDKRLGDYILPPGWLPMSAGNKMTDRSIVYETSAALNNRFCHIEVEHNYEEWHKWAVANDVHGDVVGYHIYKNGEQLMMFDPDTEFVAFPTPRSWKFASDDIIANEEYADAEEAVNDLICGHIGAHVGCEFLAYRSLQKALPPVDELLKTYEQGNRYQWPVNNGTNHVVKDAMGNEHTFEATSVIYMIAAGVASRAKDAKNTNAIWLIANDLANHGHGDFSLILALNALRRNYEALSEHHGYTEWAENHSDLANKLVGEL